MPRVRYLTRNALPFKKREFCIETMGGQEKLRLRSFFGGNETSDALHAQVNECAMRILPRYLPPASR
jgi:hypothetical protein